MALEAVIFPQDQYIKPSSLSGGEAFHCPFGFDIALHESASNGLAPGCGGVLGQGGTLNYHPPPDMSMCDMSVKKKETYANQETEEVQRLRKRPRRSKIYKNKAEAESQRMAHITVERNRRRLINDYLSALRSLMPPSYLYKGDQASIIGGAINFVKELEHLVETLEARKETNQHFNVANACQLHSPFAGLYSFTQCVSCPARTGIEGKVAADNKEALTDVKVTMVESHANVKVVSKRRPRQMLKMMIGLQSIKLTILHLYVTTIDEMVLYTLSLKVEEDCQFGSVDKLAEAIYQMIGKI